jgi:hypothetical protein
LSLEPENAIVAQFGIDGMQSVFFMHLSVQNFPESVSTQSDERQSFSPSHLSPSAPLPRSPKVQHAVGAFSVPAFAHRSQMFAQS